MLFDSDSPDDDGPPTGTVNGTDGDDTVRVSGLEIFDIDEVNFGDGDDTFTSNDVPAAEVVFLSRRAHDLWCSSGTYDKRPPPR
ncbi:hypothetical protein [Pseudooctadecabacter jejudonensis]|uniref:hypothetical protein n=1 Tax=Pseudooctadecabacter jejudonensis TaxID=1391910 RepID=UPI00117A9D3A|nr:hypothetical protein [Pseudooctadecabacter jejudonensis]